MIPIIGAIFTSVGLILLVFAGLGGGAEADHLSYGGGYAGLHLGLGEGFGLGGFLFGGVEESFYTFQHALFH